MLLRILGIFAGLTLAASQAPASTVIISYQVNNVTGNSYRYDYTVYNNGSLGTGVALKLFDIFFDPEYEESSLQIATPDPLKSQWSEQILGSVGAGFPAAYDAYSPTGIADGSFVSGFSVLFTWIGGGQPGAQQFRIYDADYNLLQSGMTTLPADPSAVPEPSTLVTLGLSIVFGSWRLRRRRS